MKQPVTIEHASPGLQPPVYIFTSLSEPQWADIEMDHEKLDSGEYRFSKTFNAEEGDYQYKFRLGPGDWWVVDETKPLVDDGAGNKNNLLVVKAADSAQAHAQSSAASPSQVAASTDEHLKDVVQRIMTPEPETVLPPPAPGQATAVSQASALPASPPTDQPAQVKQPQAVDVPSATTLNQASATPHVEPPAPAPLMKHETLAPPTETVDEEDEDQRFDIDDGDEDDGPPLLRHESLAPGSQEQTQAPLLRHESMAIGEHQDEDPQATLSPSMTSMGSRGSGEEDPVPEEADPDDPSLESFPTDSNGILEHIHHASTELPEDKFRDDADVTSAAVSETPISPVTSLPSVQEDDEEMDELREYEREKAEKEAETEEVDPMAPTVIVTEVAQQRPAALMTPPMTPKEAESIIEAVTQEQLAEAGVENEGRDEVREQIIEAIIVEQRAEAAAEQEAIDEVRELAQDSKIVVEIEQDRGVFGTMADILTHPMSLLAFAGIALAVAAGVWKLRYA